MKAREHLLNAVAGPLVCYVTDRRSFPPPSRCNASTPLGWAFHLLDTISRAAEAGVDAIQLREKDLSGRMLFDLAAAANARANGNLIVNDRLDVALAIEAAGVHLGGESVPVAEVSRLRSSVAPASRAGQLAGGADTTLSAAEGPGDDSDPQAGVGRRRYETESPAPAQPLPENFLVGRSCHSLDEALDAQRAGADYIFFGPVFATPSKLQFGPPQGLDALAGVCRAVRVPVFAIGGITIENARSCLASGAAGLAAIRLFQEASDLAAVVKALKQQL